MLSTQGRGRFRPGSGRPARDGGRRRGCRRGLGLRWGERQAEPERRPPRRGDEGERASVGLGDLGGDGQPEAGAAPLPGPRGVGAVEPLEDAGADPGSIPGPSSATTTVAGRVGATRTVVGVPAACGRRAFARRLSRICCSRTSSPHHARPAQSHRAGWGGPATPRGRPRRPARRARPGRPGPGRAAGPGPSGPAAAGPRRARPCAAPRPRCAPWPSPGPRGGRGPAAEQLGVAADRRERRAQLVRGVGHEPPKPPSLASPLVEGLLDLGEHGVQGQSPSRPTSVSSSAGLDALREVAGGDGPGGVAHRHQGPQTQPDQPPGEQRRPGSARPPLPAPRPAAGDGACRSPRSAGRATTSVPPGSATVRTASVRYAGSTPSAEVRFTVLSLGGRSLGRSRGARGGSRGAGTSWSSVVRRR